MQPWRGRAAAVSHATVEIVHGHHAAKSIDQLMVGALDKVNVTPDQKAAANEGSSAMLGEYSGTLLPGVDNHSLT